MNRNWKAKFFTIWSGQALSVLSSAVLQMALIWHLSLQTNSAAILSLASIAGFLPMAILGIFAGTLVDRWNKKVTIIAADLSIALVSLVLAIVGLFAEIPVWLVLVILFLRSIGASFHSPAINAITPLLVPEDQLTRCSGYTQSLQSVGYILGAAIAAALYPIWSLSGLVLLDVVGAALASAAVLLIHIPKLPAPEVPVQPHFFAEMKAGYAAIRSSRGLFALLWIGAGFMVLYSPINALFPLMSLDYFGGTVTSASIAEIAFAVGMLGGGVLLGAWGGWKNRSHTIVAALALMSLTIGASGLLPPSGFTVFAVLCVFMGLSVPFYTGPQMALMQEKIPPEYLGRVFGLYGSITSFAMPIGLVLSGLFADRLGIHTWFALTGAACLLLTGVTLCLRSVRQIDKP